MAVKSGLITIGEGRRRLNENSFFINDDDDFLLLSQGYIHAYKDRIICPNSSSIINLNDEQVTKKGENNNAADL
ncbi:hypothetical protein ONV75_01715 [Clostridium sp. LQ25]|uniref:hypothetical protein n=1 Tax=Clostridium sp. LQ25 TaxID=2992805 RepID=UPI00225428E7|nr:hypothetical protein [Clostridium sp. LQ25]UZT06635.1 hypothetical protein ONV75_01715 [Clostridium sp. LQ25]